MQLNSLFIICNQEQHAKVEELLEKLGLKPVSINPIYDFDGGVDAGYRVFRDKTFMATPMPEGFIRRIPFKKFVEKFGE